MKRIHLYFILSIIILSVLFSACNKSKKLGNTLRIALRAKVRSIDPAHGGDYYSNVEISRAYEGLLQYHYTKRPYEIIPRLAESMPQVSKDKKTYQFKIKKGIYFHDDTCFQGGKGREVNASDFVYSLNRLLDPDEQSEGKWILDGKVETIIATDPNTLEIKLKEANAIFLHLLTMPFASVVPQECVRLYGKDFSMHPVGTGPFTLERFAQNQVVWIKNKNYWNKELPKVDRVIDDVIVEDQPAWLNFMQGNHDYLLKVPKDNATAVWGQDRKPTKEITDRNIQVHAIPGVEFTYMAFNYEDPVVGGKKNVFLRKAMSMAYDEAPTIEKFYLGLASRAEFFIPPGIPGYDQKFINPNRVYNLAKAREMLAAAGHPDGKDIPEIIYEVVSDSTSRQLAEYFQRSMAQLGIKIKLNASTWPELLSRIRKKQVQMFGINWLYDYPDAENGFQLLYSKNVSPGQNEANFSNKEYDNLFIKAAPMENSTEREKLFEKMRKIFTDECPWILGLHRYQTRLSHAWVKNYQIHAFEHNIEQYIEIDTNVRDRSLK